MRTAMPFILAVAMAALLFSGCNRLTQKNYDKLKIGMNYQQVTEILGKPATCAETLGTKSCTWGGKNRNIKVVFLGEKATLFSNQNIQ